MNFITAINKEGRTKQFAQSVWDRMPEDKYGYMLMDDASSVANPENSKHFPMPPEVKDFKPKSAELVTTDEAASVATTLEVNTPPAVVAAKPKAATKRKPAKKK